MPHQDFISRPRRALLIGIDEYPNFQQQEQLEGCRNDVELARSTLLARGYDAAEVSTLLDAEASREGIVTAIEKLVQFVESAASKGAAAEVFVHYSGHGSYFIDEGKSSGLSETLVPYDSGRRPSDRNLDILDKWIDSWLERLRQSAYSVVWVVDSCHSGSIARGVARRRLLPPSAHAPESPPPWWQGGRGMGGDDMEGAGYVLASACHASETACEIGAIQGSPSSAYGAFSYHFYRALRNAQQGAIWIDVFELARLQVTATFPTQNPQLEGDRQRSVSTGDRQVADRYVLISDCDDLEIRLDGGALHGLAEGSIWAIYPTGTRVPETDQQVSRAEVLEVESTAARAKLLDETPPGVILPGFRAFEWRRSESSDSLRVYVPEVADVSSRRDLVAGLQTAPGVALTDSLAEAHVIFLEQPSSSESSTWQASFSDGTPLGSAQRIDDSAGLSNLIANLVRLARYRRMLDLASRHSWMPCALHFLVETEQGWAEAETTRQGGDFSFVVGQRMAFKVTNLGQESIFPYLFHLGDQGEIHLLDPVRGGHEALAPGKSRTIGKGRRKLTATWTGSQEEHIQLFASLSEIDLGFLTQSGFRGLGGPDVGSAEIPSEASIAAGLLGTIAARGMSIDEAETWGTLKRSFRVFKRQ